MKHLSTPEPLESRIAPASAVARALDLPDSTIVDVSEVKLVALGVANNFAAGGLGGIPTGPDNDFLIFSTGDATKAYAPRGSYPIHGLDFGKKGTDSEFQHLKVTVPVAPGQTHVKFDFNFMSDETPHDPFGPFDDTFFVSVTPDNGGTTGLVDMSVEDDIFMRTGLNPTDPFVKPVNAIYSKQTGVYTADYRIPAGATSVTFDFYLNEYPQPGQDTRYPDGDGTGDTAVAIDNFRFTSARQTVWLNFEGATLTNMITQGTSIQVPAFQPADIGSAGDRATLINSIVAGVAAKYDDFEIDFVLTQPAVGDYLAMSIGGTDNNVLTLSGVTDPRLTALGTTTTTGDVLVALGGSKGTYGMANSVDFGNTSLKGDGFIHSGLYATDYSTDTVAVIQQRLVGTIAHEIGHALGAAHLVDGGDNDANLMAQYSPRSPTASFLDQIDPLVKANPDGRTQINVHEYLQGVLGSSSDSVFVNGTSVALSQQILRLILSLPIFGFRIGVTSDAGADSDGGIDSTIQWLPATDLPTGATELKIPNFGPGTRLVFFGSTVDGGPVDFFSGTPTLGDMTPLAGFVDLFDGTGTLMDFLPAAQGTLGGGLSEFAGGVGVGISAFASVGLNPINAKTGFTFTQADGDIVTVKLGSKTGSGAISLTPDGNDIDRIELQGTNSKDSLTISVKRKGDGPDVDKFPDGDGSVNINSIAGSALGKLSATNADLIGAGLQFGGVVGSVTVRDVENGADIFLGGTFATKTKLTAHEIGDGTSIDVDGQLKITAARIGAGTIEAALLGSLVVKGDAKGLNPIQGNFESDITIVPGKVLTVKEAKMNLLAGVKIAGQAIDVDISVPGHVGTFKTGTFEHSSLLVGFAPTAPANPLAGGLFGGDFKLGSFTATGIKDSLLPAFDDSVVIAAQLGAVSLASIDADNGGTAFGFAAKNGLEKNIATIVVKADDLKIDKNSVLPFTDTDFTVKLI